MKVTRQICNKDMGRYEHFVEDLIGTNLKRCSWRI